jgi:hypothetical protein
MLGKTTRQDNAIVTETMTAAIWRLLLVGCSISNVCWWRHALVPANLSAAKSGRGTVVQHVEGDICLDDGRTGRLEAFEPDRRRLVGVAGRLDLASGLRS